MPGLMISRCYEEMFEDSSLQLLFLEEEWRSFGELPFLGTLQFGMVSQRLVAHLSSSSMWGQARVEFFLGCNWKISTEIISMVVLITDGWKREAWAWWLPFVTMIRLRWIIWSSLHIMSVGLSQTKCSGGQNICQLPLPPQGSSRFLYLGVTTLSLGALTTQFP